MDRSIDRQGNNKWPKFEPRTVVISKNSTGYLSI